MFFLRFFKGFPSVLEDSLSIFTQNNDHTTKIAILTYDKIIKKM